MQEQIKQLIEQLQHPDSQVRGKAHWALVDMGPVVVPYVLPLLEHPSPTVRWEAAFVLSEIAAEEAAEALVKLLEDDFRSVRRMAAVALINIGKPALIPLLKALVERGSTSPLLREEARVVLNALKEDLKEELGEHAGKLEALLRELNGLHQERIPRPDRVPELAYELLKALLVSPQE